MDGLVPHLAAVLAVLKANETLLDVLDPCACEATHVIEELAVAMRGQGWSEWRAVELLGLHEQNHSLYSVLPQLADAQTERPHAVDAHLVLRIRGLHRHERSRSRRRWWPWPAVLHQQLVDAGILLDPLVSVLLVVSESQSALRERERSFRLEILLETDGRHVDGVKAILLPRSLGAQMALLVDIAIVLQTGWEGAGGGRDGGASESASGRNEGAERRGKAKAPPRVSGKGRTLQTTSFASLTIWRNCACG